MSPEIAKKLENPMVKKALAHWANYAAGLILNGKSERQVKYWIQKAMQNQLSHHGLEIIWKMAVVKAEEVRMRSLPIVIASSHGNS